MLLNKKNGIVFGVSNKNSIAYHISKSFKKNGANLHGVMESESIHNYYFAQISDVEFASISYADVRDKIKLKEVLKNISSACESGIDFVVYSIARSHSTDKYNSLINSTPESIIETIDVCCTSFIFAISELRYCLNDGASVFAITHDGAMRHVQNYGVLGVAKAALESSIRYLAFELGRHGIRVNALSTGLVPTLSSASIPGFRAAYSDMKRRAPLKKKLTTEMIANSALFLASDLSQSTTGEILYSDMGRNICGVELT